MAREVSQATKDWALGAASRLAALGFAVIDAEELDRLKAVDAKHGWKERPPSPNASPGGGPHKFEPGKKHFFVCTICAYGPGAEWHVSRSQDGTSGTNDQSREAIKNLTQGEGTP